MDDQPQRMAGSSVSDTGDECHCETCQHKTEQIEHLAADDIALRYWWQRCLKAERELRELRALSELAPYMR